MLSLSKVKDVSYYTQLSSANHGVEYYFSKEERQNHSFWHGTLARELGLLSKPVEREDMLDVFNSITTKNARKDRLFGVDLTFSAPKSVSLAYLLLGDKRVLDAHLKAVLLVL